MDEQPHLTYQYQLLVTTSTLTTLHTLGGSGTVTGAITQAGTIACSIAKIQTLLLTFALSTKLLAHLKHVAITRAFPINLVFT
jgi:hypothetical protein